MQRGEQFQREAMPADACDEQDRLALIIAADGGRRIVAGCPAQADAGQIQRQGVDAFLENFQIEVARQANAAFFDRAVVLGGQ